jgi:hypothetical protein
MNARKNLTAKLRAQGLPSPDRPLPIVPLEDFFAGNNDYGSIGCNLGFLLFAKGHRVTPSD